MALEELFPFSINETSLGSKVNCNKAGEEEERDKKEERREGGGGREKRREGGEKEGGKRLDSEHYSSWQ